MMVGIVIGGIARLSTNNLKLFEFSPEVFFFVLLPPIIFGKFKARAPPSFQCLSLARQ
jgi:hypothetical protein